MVLPRQGLQVRLIVLSLLFLIGVLSILFVELPGSSLLWRELQNTGHTILFALMTLAFMSILQVVLPAAADKVMIRYAITFAVVAIVAVLTELSQQLTHREPSLIDMARDMAGVLIGLGLYAYIDPGVMARCKRHCHVLKIVTLILSACLLAVSLFPLLHLAFAYVQRNQAFPVVIDFQAAWPKPFLHINQAVLTQIDAADFLAINQNRSVQQQVTKLQLKRGKYPGISIIEPYPDWSAYNTLILELYSPQAHAFGLVLRIHDSQHNQSYSDRFNQRLTVKPGNNRFRIPLLAVEQAPASRDMSMMHISNLMFFAVDIDDSIELYPVTVKLE